MTWLRQIKSAPMGRVCQIAARCERCGNPTQYEDTTDRLAQIRVQGRGPPELPCAACERYPTLLRCKLPELSAIKNWHPNDYKLPPEDVRFEQRVFEKRQFQEGREWGWLWVEVS